MANTNNTLTKSIADTNTNTAFESIANNNTDIFVAILFLLFYIPQRSFIFRSHMLIKLTE